MSWFYFVVTKNPSAKTNIHPEAGEKKKSDTEVTFKNVVFNSICTNV